MNLVHAFGMIIFEMKDLRATDFGSYECILRNKAGEARSTFQLKQCSPEEERMIPRFTSKFNVKLK